MRPLITFTTDFGSDSPYVAQMKAAAWAIAEDARLVDITHSIAPQDIRHAAWVLADSAAHFREGSVHVVVVDPGVGSDRDILACRSNGRLYVGPDNGVLSEVRRRNGLQAARRVTNRAFWADRVSATFHGRDIMAPVAAHLARGTPLEQLGPAAARIAEPNWAPPAKTPEGARGEIISIDAFGNLISNIPGEWLPSGAAKLRIRCGRLELHALAHNYAEGHSTAGQTDPGQNDPGQNDPGQNDPGQNDPGQNAPGRNAPGRNASEQTATGQGRPIALIGSHGGLELAVPNGNAARQLGIERGAAVEVQWWLTASEAGTAVTWPDSDQPVE